MSEPAGTPGRMRGIAASARSSWKQWLPFAVLVAALTYPFWFDVPPFSLVTQDVLALNLDVAIQIAVYVMLALGLNVVVGEAGLLDLGYVAFFALGAYTVAWLASDQFSGIRDGQGIHIWSTALDSVPGIHVSIWIVILLAGVVTATAGIIIGWPTLRLRGDYLALVTLGFGEIIPDVFNNGDSMPVPKGFQARPPFLDFVNENLTNGVRGIKPLDRPGFPNIPFLPDRFTSSDLKPWYFTIVIMVVLTFFVLSRIHNSKLGRSWIAVREDEVAASAMGIPLMRTKLWAYAMGAVFGGFAGGFYGSFVGAAFPSSFNFSISVVVLVMVIVGGMGNMYGVMLGAVVIEYLNFTGMDQIDHGVNNFLGLFSDLDANIVTYKFLIFGALLVGMMLLRPEGILPSERRKAELHEIEFEGPETTYGDLYDIRDE